MRQTDAKEEDCLSSCTCHCCVLFHYYQLLKSNRMVEKDRRVTEDANRRHAESLFNTYFMKIMRMLLRRLEDK